MLYEVITGLLLVDVRLHPEQIHDTPEPRLRAERKLDRNGVDLQDVGNLIDRLLKIRPLAIHLRDKCDRGNSYNFV